MDLGPFFKEYEQLVQQVDRAFEKVKNGHSENVTCRLGCCDCCFALFDISLVEALYIKHHFDERFVGEPRSDVLSRANKADRLIHRLKKQAYQDHGKGKTDDEIIEFMADQRVRCPVLNEQDQCLIYDVRPITCRLYGIPIEIGGFAHTCGKSGFSKGVSYQTVKMDQIHKRLNEISYSLAQAIHSQYPKLDELIVPLSMALLTDYSEEYLGVINAAVQKDTQ